MLDYLRIQDLALIEDVSMEFAPGINVLTGETGAGKSFILKALSFLTGDRLETDLVRPGKEKAFAEAIFTMPDGQEYIIRRELAAETGRSRLFINDKLSSQDLVRELKPAILMHTSQHGQQKLLQPAFQAKILDDFMNRADLLNRKVEIMQALTELNAKKKELEVKFQSLEERRDLLEFQRQEIDKVNPQEGEEDDLEQKRQDLRQVERCNSSVEQALEALHGEGQGQGIMGGLALLERAVKHMAETDESFAGDLGFVQEMYPTLSELSSRLRKATQKRSFNYNAEGIESRLFEIAQLKRKLRKSLPEILALRDEVTQNLEFLDNCALDLKQLSREEQKMCAALAELLAELNPARRAAAQELRVLLEDELRALGFSQEIAVIFNFEAKQLYPACPESIEDKASILWQPNPGQTAQPLDKIASGGELSRFLLALVALLSKRSSESPTLIFDEVDSGVGGITLNKVGEKLRSLGDERQMLLITHWPNLAAKADRHFFIQKQVLDGETYTNCKRLDDKEIMEEITRMGGGGEQGKSLARELLSDKS